MNIWPVMLILGGLTFGMRLSFIFMMGRLRAPEWVFRALRFVPPAVLTAIVFPEVFMTAGRLTVSPGNERLLAGLLAALVAWRTKNAVLTVVVGMTALWLLRLAGGLWGG